MEELGALALISRTLHPKVAAVILVRTSVLMAMLIRSVSTRAVLTGLIRIVVTAA